MIDIDADTSDPVTVSEYATEIFVNMKRREVGTLILLIMCTIGIQCEVSIDTLT